MVYGTGSRRAISTTLRDRWNCKGAVKRSDDSKLGVWRVVGVYTDRRRGSGRSIVSAKCLRKFRKSRSSIR